MIIVDGKPFVKENLKGVSWKIIEKQFKGARISMDTVKKAWETVNPSKVKKETSDKEE